MRGDGRELSAERKKNDSLTEVKRRDRRVSGGPIGLQIDGQSVNDRGSAGGKGREKEAKTNAPRTIGRDETKHDEKLAVCWGYGHGRETLLSRMRA